MYSENFSSFEFKKFIYNEYIKRIDLYKERVFINSECKICKYNKKCYYISSEIYNSSFYAS
jgi:hypothetical protein